MLTSIRGLVAATLIAATGLVAMPAQADQTAPPAEFTVTGSAAVVSQYRFRGLSQSDNLPAVQGSITLNHASGLYVGTWGSSASNKTSPINIGGTEIDVFGGYSKTISGITLDGGVYGYLYPGATAGNYYELYGSLAKTLGPAKAKVGVNFAPAQKVFNYNFSSPTRSNTYVYGELSGGVPKTPFSVHTHLGYSSGGFDFGRDYLDYSAGVSYTWKALTLDASIVGTDLSRNALVNTFGPVGSFGNEQAFRQGKTVGVVSLTASF
ncbi:MAG: TorF family putative porin [Sphingomonadales bacterium]|nr:TorF family putative porin [Sphingomonadales bacterium]